MIKINRKYLDNFIADNELDTLQPFVDLADDMLRNKTGLGKDFLGWLNLPTEYDKEELKKIKKSADKINQTSDILIVIGIGGSYLGAKAVVDLCSHSFANVMNKNTTVYFAGHNMSSTYLSELVEAIAGKDFSINVISKSGTTTEPAIAFRFFKRLLVEKYGEVEANKRIYATTDSKSGALKTQADKYGWESFIIPGDVGGRFSVLTAVGLLPIAVAGIDVDEILKGAQNAQIKYCEKDIKGNAAYQYAAIRNIMYTKGKTIEMLVSYESKMQYFNEWFKQLFGESEGKNGKGLFPTSAIFSTDLHSLGQYIQEGRKDLFETVVYFQSPQKDLRIDLDDNDLDELNYLASRKISEVNQKIFEATTIAHSDGNVPNIIIELEAMNERVIGELIYFFQISCAISGYLLGVNPFDQPGVEKYKENMFGLLGKPGFEAIGEELKRRK